MGVGGIVGQAAFIPVASSMSVVAPILAIQALGTAVTLHQFKQVDQKLDAVKDAVDTAIARNEATHAGELLAGSRIVDEVYQQYQEAGEFSNDMLVRLALAEREVRRLAERFRFLVDAHAVGSVDVISDVRRANYDVHSSLLASFLGLRIAYLRVCVDMQENPKSVATSVQRLKDEISADVDFGTKRATGPPNCARRLRSARSSLATCTGRRRRFRSSQEAEVQQHTSSS
ncbi:hypothetical protein [Ornithinimicrobium sp. INDO-MA30-4]|uniref:hypothetical protein n=1 Tax=Ornithinimicrobium sp. INDO-MA30-4 TaxID=2908651 RepID=UPI001F1C4638|nr:hypothetical protein [Ornithinimicrobium sp. INDO-MA30-4]UJH71178.1 hypothetical protein L0A91_04910 [Ornithinimicrobium sp. INDO-MA30-4]